MILTDSLSLLQRSLRALPLVVETPFHLSHQGLLQKNTYACPNIT